MGIYNKDGVCNKCGMYKRVSFRGNPVTYCYRNVPRKRYNWINIEDKLPLMNKTILVKSNKYGVQESRYIKTNEYPASEWCSYDRTIHTFDTDCPSAKNKWDTSVIQWAEL